MVSKLAVLDSDNRVVNVILAAPDYSVDAGRSAVELDGESVVIGAYYDGSAFWPPRLAISGNSEVKNDGSDVATVALKNEWHNPVTATLSIADLSESVEIPAGGSISREITATDAAGTSIEIVAESDDSEIRGAAHTIGVVAA
jgi:hypothetical protein